MLSATNYPVALNHNQTGNEESGGLFSSSSKGQNNNQTSNSNNTNNVKGQTEFLNPESLMN